MSHTISRTEIAEELRLKSRQAAFRIRELETKHGFPRPLPGSTTLYSRRQVEAWFAAGGRPAEPAPAPAAPRDPVTAARESLEARYVA